MGLAPRQVLLRLEQLRLDLVELPGQGLDLRGQLLFLAAGHAQRRLCCAQLGQLLAPGECQG